MPFFTRIFFFFAQNHHETWPAPFHSTWSQSCRRSKEEGSSSLMQKWCERSWTGRRTGLRKCEGTTALVFWGCVCVSFFFGYPYISQPCAKEGEGGSHVRGRETWECPGMSVTLWRGCDKKQKAAVHVMPMQMKAVQENWNMQLSRRPILFAICWDDCGCKDPTWLCERSTRKRKQMQVQ